MSNIAPKAISKPKKERLHEKTVQRNALLELMLRGPVEMPQKCSACEKSGADCVGGDSSSRCTACVKNNLSRCDANPLTPEQLRHIATQHTRLEAELEEVEEERRRVDAKIQRLRANKKRWYEKMVRAVARGIDNVEELERVEREEAEEEARRKAAAEPSSSITPALPDDFSFDWDGTYPDVPLSPSLLNEFGLLDGSGSVDPSVEPGGTGQERRSPQHVS